MKQRTPPSDLSWPKWRWQVSRWLYVIFGVLTVVVFIILEYNILPLSNRIIIIVILFILPLIAATLVLAGKIIHIIYQRVNQYPKVYEQLKKQEELLTHAYKQLGNFTPILIKLEIKKVLYNREKERLYIVIIKNTELDLSEGDNIIVVDLEDDTLMGEFEITQIRTYEYYAIDKGNVSMWLGYIRQEGKTEMLPPPNTGAFLIPRREIQ